MVDGFIGATVTTTVIVNIFASATAVTTNGGNATHFCNAVRSSIYSVIPSSRGLRISVNSVNTRGLGGGNAAAPGDFRVHLRSYMFSARRAVAAAFANAISSTGDNGCCAVFGASANTTFGGIDLTVNSSLNASCGDNVNVSRGVIGSASAGGNGTGRALGFGT